MEINQVILTALVGQATMLWFAMEALLKPGIKRIFGYLSSKYGSIDETSGKRRPIDKRTQFMVYQVMASILGISFVIVTESNTLADLFSLDRTKFMDKSIEYIDVILTGIAISFGNKGIHWTVDLFQEYGQVIRDILEAKIDKKPTIEI